LDFDLATAIAAFQKARLEHRLTIGIPAPTAHPLVEQIVDQHDGKFEIIDESELPTSDPSSLTQQVVRMFDVLTNLIGELKARGLVPASFGNELQHEHTITHKHTHGNGSPHEH
jgi:hypothetical protein